MATYGYRCPDCGPYDVVRPMAAADDGQLCPGCGNQSSRLFSPPAVRRVSPGLSRVLSAAERSADHPEVVRALPTDRRADRPGSRRPADPRHAALPRP